MAVEQDLKRVVVTDAAKALLAEIRAEHGDIVFQLSAGCCDGSGPMCYKAGDVFIGASDVLLGSADGADIWASESIFGLWERSQLILDAAPGSGNGFSLDNGRDTSFITRARILTESECAALGLSERA